MRPVTKIILAVVAFLALLQAAVVVGLTTRVPYLSPIIRNQWSWLRPTTLALTVVIITAAVITLIIAVFRRSTTQDLHLVSEQGELVIAKKGIESSVARSIVANHDVQNADVAVRLHHKAAAEAKVRVQQWQVQDAKGLAAAVEQTVRQQLESTLGVAVRKVRVRIMQADKPSAAQVI